MHIGAWQEYKLYKLMILQKKFDRVSDFSSQKSEQQSDKSSTTDLLTIKTDLPNRYKSQLSVKQNSNSNYPVVKARNMKSIPSYSPSKILKDSVNSLQKVNMHNEQRKNMKYNNKMHVASSSKIPL